MCVGYIQKIFSSLYLRSSIAVRKRQALSGNRRPPGFYGNKPDNTVKPPKADTPRSGHTP